MVSTNIAMAAGDIQFYLAIFLLFLLWITSITLFFQYILKKPTKNSSSTTLFHLPPSPPALPVIGHIHLLKPVAHEGFQALSEKYGPLLHLFLGSYRLLLVSSASYAAEIFRSHDLAFSYKPSSPFDDGLMFGKSGFFNAPYGDYWRYMKKLCVTELLSARQIERSRWVRREELLSFLRRLLEKARGNEAVDVGSETTKLVNNTICRTAMSTRCSEEEDEAERIRVLIEQSMVLAGKMALGNTLGPLRKLFCSLYMKQLTELNRNYDELLEKIMKEHEEDHARRDGGVSGEREDQDFMDILLERCQDEKAELKITRNQIKAFFSDIFIGGTGTTADVIPWAIAELINHPNMFKKVREEIESVVGRSRLVEESDIPNLRYLRAAVKETLRLYPPGSMIPRDCPEGCRIGDFDIPKGTAVAINVYAIMRDPDLWDNPNEFQPDRFLDGPEEIISKGQNFSFLPFGAGRRMCPGSTLAFAVLNTSLAAMVQCFDWRPVSGDGKVSMQAASGVKLSMARPLLCQPIVHFNPFDT